MIEKNILSDNKDFWIYCPYCKVQPGANCPYSLICKASKLTYYCCNFRGGSFRKCQKYLLTEEWKLAEKNKRFAGKNDLSDKF